MIAPRLRRWRRRRWTRRLASARGPFALAPLPPSIRRVRDLARALGSRGMIEGAIRWHPFVTDPLGLILGDAEARETDPAAARAESVLAYAEELELAAALRVCYDGADAAIQALTRCPSALAHEWAREMVRAWCELAGEEAARAAAQGSDLFLRTAGAGMWGESSKSAPSIDRVLARLDLPTYFQTLTLPLGEALTWLYVSGIESAALADEARREQSRREKDSQAHRRT